MSNLRMAGLIFGIVIFILSFRVFRCPRWKRSNFIFYSLFSIALMLISINLKPFFCYRPKISLKNGLKEVVQ